MSSLGACLRVTYRRICCSQVCISIWVTLGMLIAYGACYAMTIGIWNLVSPPVNYGPAVPLAWVIFMALIIVPWTAFAFGYCLCYNPAWNSQMNTWNPEPTGFWRSCYQASWWCHCQCPGLIPFCRGYCSEIREEIQNDKTSKGGYAKEDSTSSRVPGVSPAYGRGTEAQQNKMPPLPSNTVPPV